MTDIAITDTFRLGGVFSKSFAILTRRFGPLVVLAFIAVISTYVGVAITTAAVAFLLRAGWQASGLTVLIYPVYQVVWSVADSVVMYGVIQELSGRRFSIRESLGAALRRIIPITWVAIATTIAIDLGMLLVVVPGVMAACGCYLAIPACMVERTGVFDSLSRSGSLTLGYRWQIFGTIVLLTLVNFAVVSFISLEFIARAPIMAAILIFALYAITGAWNGVLAAVFYYELRLVKEGVDLKIASVFD